MSLQHMGAAEKTEMLVPSSGMERKVAATAATGCCQRLSNRCKMMMLVAVIVVEAVAILLYSQPGFHQLMQTSAWTRCKNSKSEQTNHPTPAAPCQELELNLNREKQCVSHLPHFIIIGVKKCGTRALLTFLNIHPDIITQGREMHFFETHDDYNKGLEWYRQQMPCSYPDQLTGEKTPGYYRYKDVPEKIYAMNSSIKLIIVVKEPVERAMSNYVQLMSKSRHASISFEEAVFTSDGEVNPNSPHIFNSDYDRFIDNWLKYFPLEQLMVVDGEKLITAPYEVLDELQDFLGVRKYITRDSFIFDEDKGFYCFYNSSEAERPWCFGDTKGRPHPHMDNNVRVKLRKYFEPKIDIFFRKIRRSFDWYG